MGKSDYSGNIYLLIRKIYIKRRHTYGMNEGNILTMIAKNHSSQFEKRAEKCNGCSLNRILVQMSSGQFLCKFCRHGRKEL